MSGRAAAAAVGLAAALAAHAAEPGPPAPLAWQEPSPLHRLFLQLPFEAPAPAAPGCWGGEARLLYTNSLLVGATPGATLDVDVETAQLTAILRRGLPGGVELQLALPALLDAGGFLDRPIAAVEGWFHAANPQAVGRPRNVARFRLAGAGGGGLDREGAEGGLGDAWAGAKVALAAGGGGWPALAGRGAVKLPTGRMPFGSGTVDAGAGLLAAWTGARAALRLELDAVVPAGRLRSAGIRTRPYGAAQLGLAWSAGPGVTLALQASGHLSPLRGTGLGAIDGPTFYVLGGAAVAVGAGLEATAGVAENVFSPYRGADLSFLLGLRAR